MVLYTASDDQFDNFPYAKIHQSYTIGNIGFPYLFKATGASAAVGSVDTGSVPTVGKHSDVDNDLSLACGLDSKPHSVDVVVCTGCQSESHELGHISPNYSEKVVIAGQATRTPYAPHDTQCHDVTGALANSVSKEQEYSINQNTLSGLESLDSSVLSQAKENDLGILLES